jgi:2-polyprenyl-6-hydroxyphenyl methylase/3-demethylubiquinone-9 3-methyltransferase
MTPDAAARFAALPRLDRHRALSAAVRCKVCGAPAPFFDVQDFNRTVGDYDWGPSGIVVPWYRCRACGFLFTGLCDDWTRDEFRRFIYNEDYPLIDPDYLDKRPRGTAEQMKILLTEHRDARILDYGAGSGLFAACMADAGFRHVVAYDPISMPDRPTGPFQIIICIEVVEHSPDPTATIAEMASLLDNEGVILLGETLQPPDIDKIRCSWWYCAIRNGHLSTFADRTLADLGRRLGLAFHRSPGEIHALRRGTRFKSLADWLGPVFAAFQAGAPGRSPAQNFHAVEGIPDAQYQWTTAEKLNWTITIPPETSRVQIMVPFLHQSRHGFASECWLELNGAVSQATIRESSLFAEFDVSASGPATVTLRTPPLTPVPGGALGIAVRVTQ